MNTYIFQTGRSVELCQLELGLLLSPFNPQKRFQGAEIAVIGFDETPPIEEIMAVSGGLIKIAEQFGELKQDASDEQLLSLLSEFVHAHFPADKRVKFGLSFYTGNKFNASDLSKKLKSQLIESGRNSQFILGDSKELSSVQVAKEHLLGEQGVEFLIVLTDSGIAVGRTIAVQDFNRWSEVDYGRPGRDPKSGMLPPKVARMMVNIGLLSYKSGETEAAPLVFDPFCGSGTVLTEAFQLGCRVAGSDNSAKAIADTEANFEWLKRSQYRMLTPRYYSFPVDEKGEVLLFVSESVHVTKNLGVDSVDIVVTEPYMGPNFTEDPTPGKRDRIMKGLEKLYIGTFKELHRVLKQGGILVFAEPEYFMHGKSFPIGIIDKAEQFGYTKRCDFVSYRREHATVGRRIAVLEKK